MRNGLQKQAQEIAEGLLALFFGGPAWATTAFYGLSFIDWLFFDGFLISHCQHLRGRRFLVLRIPSRGLTADVSQAASGYLLFSSVRHSLAVLRIN
jgi:hypothetical protein